jgi:hypothetical protein
MCKNENREKERGESSSGWGLKFPQGKLEGGGRGKCFKRFEFALEISSKD